MNTNKAVGSDSIVIEILSALDDFMVHKITEIIVNYTKVATYQNISVDLSS